MYTLYSAHEKKLSAPKHANFFPIDVGQFFFLHQIHWYQKVLDLDNFGEILTMSWGGKFLFLSMEAYSTLKHTSQSFVQQSYHGFVTFLYQ